MTSTFERLRDIIVKDHQLDPARVTPETTLEALGIDSLGVADMLFNVEDVFGIVLPAEAPGALTTVGDVAGYLDGLVTAQREGTAAAVPPVPAVPEAGPGAHNATPPP